MAGPENPYAFPWRCDDNTQAGDSGMELRDWFAGQALGRLAGNDDTIARASWQDAPESYLATWAYRVADAMLAARQTTDREDGK